MLLVQKNHTNELKVFTDTLDQIGSDFRATITKTDMQLTKTLYFLTWLEVLAYFPFYRFLFTEVVEGSEDLANGLIYFNYLGQWECSIETYINNEWVVVHKEYLKIIE